MTNGRQTNDKQTTTNKNEKNDKNERSIKEKYIKENPKIQFAEFVSMTNAEHEKLVSTYGADFTNKCIEVLDNYKGANGKKYKDDYRAILNWVIDRVKKDKPEVKEKSALERLVERELEKEKAEKLYEN